MRTNVLEWPWRLLHLYATFLYPVLLKMHHVLAGIYLHTNWKVHVVYNLIIEHLCQIWRILKVQAMGCKIETTNRKWYQIVQLLMTLSDLQNHLGKPFQMRVFCIVFQQLTSVRLTQSIAWSQCNSWTPFFSWFVSSTVVFIFYC